MMAMSLPTHAQLLRKQRKADKPSGRLYNRQIWLRLRRRLLASNPLCVECQRQGRTTLATDVDHIIALADGGAAFDSDNLVCLCHACHSRKTVKRDGGFGRGREGG